MATIMNVQRVNVATRQAQSARAFAQSSLRGTAIRALPVRAVRRNINTVCRAIVS